jgi:hypothetical protein
MKLPGRRITEGPATGRSWGRKTLRNKGMERNSILRRHPTPKRGRGRVQDGSSGYSPAFDCK